VEAARNSRIPASTCLPVFVVLGVRHDLEDKDLLAPVKYSSDEAILVAANVKQVFDSSPAILAVSPFAMERQLYSLASHGATS
jgi:hypothetical protein